MPASVQENVLQVIIYFFFRKNEHCFKKENKWEIGCFSPSQLVEANATVVFPDMQVMHRNMMQMKMQQDPVIIQKYI